MKREVWDHPKTYELADRLEIPAEYAAGLLGKMWNWCADVAPQGDIGKWSDGAIARALNWKGDSSEFIQAFVDTGWLDRDAKHRLIVHDIRDHAQNWWHAKLKKLNLEFVEPTGFPIPEGDEGEFGDASKTTSKTPSKSAESGGSEAAILQTSGNLWSSQETPIGVSGEQTRKPASPPPEPSEFSFPVTGKGGIASKTWVLPRSKLEEYRDSYPGLDVDSEMRKARQWCRDNPQKRKSPGGMLAFLTKWLNRAVNAPAGSGSSQRPAPQRVEDIYPPLQRPR